MRGFRFVQAFSAGVATLGIALASALPAAAATLTAIRVDAQPTGGAVVSVTFTGGTPVPHVIGAGTPETSVLFDATSLGTVPPSIAGAGPINSISVAQTGASSSLSLHLSGAAPVRVRTAGATIFIDVSPPQNQQQLGVPAAPVPSAIGLGPITEVVPLKYADVSEIAGVLVAGSNVTTNDTFSPVQTNIGTSSLSGSFGGVSGGSFTQQPPTQTFGGGAFGAPQGVAQRVNDNIAIDRRLNAIILSGTADVVAGLKVLIDKLDIPVASVILETQIVELSDNAGRQIGLDFSPDGSGIVVNATRSSSGTSSSGSTTTGGLTFGTQQQGTASASLQAALYAQISEGNGRVIAKPRILAQSGQQASILTGDAIPIITQVLVANSGSGSSVSYVNVGVNLQILPRVSSDGFVTSHIYSEVSSVTSFTQGVPQISQRTASTLATVRDGDSFVIGGLLQDSEIRSLSKLPFIGDIPLIGLFFRHINTSHTQTNLYIVVTPHIINPGASGSAPVQPLILPTPLPQVSAPPPPGAAGNSPAPLTPPTTVASPQPH